MKRLSRLWQLALTFAACAPGGFLSNDGAGPCSSATCPAPYACRGGACVPELFERRPDGGAP